MIRLTALLAAAALAVALGTPLLAQEPHRGGEERGQTDHAVLLLLRRQG